MFISVTFTASEKEVLAGIPETVTITSNQNDALIFYTTDTSIPTMASNLYTGPISMPFDRGMVPLSAIAYVFDGYVYQPSTILSHIYMTDHSDLDRYRYLFFEGINIIYEGGLDIPFLYGPSGAIRVAIDEDPADLEFVVSNRDLLGIYREDELNQKITDAAHTPDKIDDGIALISDPSDINFNPNALVIVSDSRAGAPINQVEIINGPFMSLRDPVRNFNGLDMYSPRGTNFVSGSMVGLNISRQNKVLVAYYVDFNSNRWVKSINDLPDAPESAPVKIMNTPLVFKWNTFGRPNRNVY